MAITAALVKELRERTGSGMMECKKALVETDGDIELAIENMRKSGQAKAAKKAGRIAAEGLIIIAQTDDAKKAVVAEVNCETDFVAKDDNFVTFANAVANRAMNSEANDIDSLLALPLNDNDATTVEEARAALVVKIGENMSVRRFSRVATDGVIGSYRHGVRIGVLVELDGGDAALAKDIAMHVAATNPLCISEDDMPADALEKERDIFRAQALESGKPPEIVDKMIGGRIRKYLAENTLLGQTFVKDPDTTVGKLLDAAGATVKSIHRLEVGEGIEKKQDNFVEEVMAQARGE